MKKNVFILVSILTLVIAGCTMTEDRQFEPVDISGHTLIDVDFESLLFTDERMLWPEDAAIGVYGSEQGYNEKYHIKNAGVGRADASFYGPMVRGTVAAYYPYSSSYIGDAGAMPYTLESEQVYDADMIGMYLRYSPMAFAHMKDGRMKFYYPNGMLRMTLDYPDIFHIKGLRVDSQSYSLAGLAVVQGDGSVRLTDNSSSFVSLDCGTEGIPSKSEDGRLAEFCVLLHPGTYDDLKLTLVIEELESPFVFRLPEIVVEKVDAQDFKMATVAIRPAEGPDGFVEEEVEFDEE